MSAVFATDTINWYMLQSNPLITLHTCLHIPGITQTGVATPKLATFRVDTQSSHPRQWPNSGIGASSSSDD